MRVDLVGGMGCGKSTLARKLQEQGGFWVAEVLEDNPFLKECYKDFDTFKFPSQMWFALTKYHEIGLYDDNDEIYIHDQSVINNNAYTNLMFKEDYESEARELVQKTFDFTTEYFGTADVLIWIHCKPAVQLERIKQRGRDYEKDIDLDFLIGLENEITQLMFDAMSLGYNDKKVIEVHSDAIDFENDPKFVEVLWETLKTEQEKLDKDLTQWLEKLPRSGTENT
jgi:deoxyguanosine kinase